MYLSDFIDIVRRHTAPDAVIHYHKKRHGPIDTITVLDYGYPRRTGELLRTGHHAYDWYISSFICNMTTSEMPRWDIDGVWLEPKQTYDEHGIPIIRNRDGGWAIRPATGYKPLLMRFLGEGLIVPSYELDVLLSYDTRKSAKQMNRLYYIGRDDEE